MSTRNKNKKKLLLAGILFLMLFFGAAAPSQAAWGKNNNYYTDASGARLKGKQKIGANWYYFSLNNGKLVRNRWVKIDRRFYYFDENGVMQRHKWLSGYTYYVGTKGYRLTNQWKGARYLGKKGKAYTGFQKVGEDYYYFDPKTKEKVVNTVLTIKGKRWQFDSEGRGSRSKIPAPGAGVDVQPQYYTHPAADDETLLSYIIYCEAGNQPYEGKLAVGYVVLNRVYSKQFRSSTVREVIYERNQFAPTWDGSMARVFKDPSLVNEECKRAARYLIKKRKRFASGKKILLNLNGQKVPFPYLFFANPAYTYASGFAIGDHVFYR